MPSVSTSIRQQRLSVTQAPASMLTAWSDAALQVRAATILNRLHDFAIGIPTTFRVKDVRIAKVEGTPAHGINSVPTVTASGGGSYTVSIGQDSIIPRRYPVIRASIWDEATGTNKPYITGFIITDPGQGFGSSYLSAPDITITDPAATPATYTAYAVMEPDPIADERRRILLEALKIMMQYYSPSGAGMAELRSEIAAGTRALDDFDNALISRMDGLIRMINPGEPFTLGAVVKSIESGVNDALRDVIVPITNVTSVFALGEKVSTSTGSGLVALYDTNLSQLTITHVAGQFEDGQTITGATSSASATTSIQTVVTGASNEQIARGMMMLNLKATDKLDDLREEISNPTTL